MSDDFSTRLRLELRAAAEREAHRGRPARAGRALRGSLPTPALAGVAVALCAVVVAAVALATSLRGQPPPATASTLHVASHLQLEPQGAGMTVGLGGVWAADSTDRQLLRLDPRTGRVVGRVGTGIANFGVDTGAGSVWALSNGVLARVDPRSGRVSARVRLPGLGKTFDTGNVHILVSGAHAWVFTSATFEHVDLRRAKVDRVLDVTRNGYTADGADIDGGTLYVHLSDGTLESRDAGTGALEHSVGLPAQDVFCGVHGGRLLVASGGGVSLLDARTLRTLWTRPLDAAQLNGVALEAPDRLWIQATPKRGGSDRLWRLDYRSGRVTGQIALPDFGVAGVAATGGRALVVNLGGKLTVVR